MGGGRREHTGEVLMSMTWGWNVDEEQGQRGFSPGERCLEEPSEWCYEKSSRRKVGYFVVQNGGRDH